MTAFKYSKADVLDNRVDQVNRPFEPGRMTTDERDAILDPQQGAIVFNTDDGTLQTFKGALWEDIDSSPPP